MVNENAEDQITRVAVTPLFRRAEKAGGAVNWPWTHREELVKKSPPCARFPPGEKWSYSNSGYLDPRRSHSPCEWRVLGDFLQHHVFQPLQMNSTRIISEADIVPNRPPDTAL